MSLITPDFGLLFWMTLIFGIVFFILAKFGFPMITSMVDKRAKHIEQALQDAQKASEQLAGMQATCQKMLDETRAQQEQMLEQARKSSARTLEEAREQASRQTAQMLASARAEIEVQKQEAMNDVRNVVVELSVAVAEKVLRERLDKDEAQMAFVDKILEEVEQSRGKSSKA